MPTPLPPSEEGAKKQPFRRKAVFLMCLMCLLGLLRNASLGQLVNSFGLLSISPVNNLAQLHGSVGALHAVDRNAIILIGGRRRHFECILALLDLK